jgi:hypothetical protein
MATRAHSPSSESQSSGLWSCLEGSYILANALAKRAVWLFHQEQLKLENSRLRTILHSKRFTRHDVQFGELFVIVQSVDALNVHKSLVIFLIRELGGRE